MVEPVEEVLVHLVVAVVVEPVAELLDCHASVPVLGRADDALGHGVALLLAALADPMATRLPHLGEVLGLVGLAITVVVLVVADLVAGAVVAPSRGAGAHRGPAVRPALDHASCARPLAARSPQLEEVLVELAVAVVVDAIAAFRGAGVDAGIAVGALLDVLQVGWPQRAAGGRQRQAE